MSVLCWGDHLEEMVKVGIDLQAKNQLLNLQMVNLAAVAFLREESWDLTSPACAHEPLFPLGRGGEKK